ncbi:MAG: MarR family transcriptional regulator [Anaerolineae bacterium]|nr:MarR family transcriptional regulator [Anaerolineae bacterium]
MATDSDDKPGNAADLPVQNLMDIDIPGNLPPIYRLLLAVLRQAVIDYFGDDPMQQSSAADYFKYSSFYRETLEYFNLPDNLLPVGVDLSAYRQEEPLNNDYELDPMKLETLVRQLSGTQLKIVLTMGLMPLPALTRQIGFQCGLSRSTTLTALSQLLIQGLITREKRGDRDMWAFPASVQQVIKEVWGTRGADI